jgi:putative phosphoesterase
MKVAFLSDVHANLYTLMTAIKNARKLGASQIFVAGDILGRGPHPLEVVRFLRDNRIPVIRGNVERKLLHLKQGKKDMFKLLDGKKENLAWNALQLDNDAWNYIATLPEYLGVTLEGFDVLIVHGSPLSDKDYVYPSITPYGIRTKLAGDNPDILVCGHSHIPFTKKLENLLVVNCGSTGLSIDGDPRPSFALASLTAGKPAQCRILRFSYSLSEMISSIRPQDIPGFDEEDYLKGVRNIVD